MLIPAFAILLIACAAIYYQYFFKKSSWGFAAKTIVVEPFNVVNESDQNIGALPDMIKYLIIDDLLQSSRENVHVFSQKDFELAHDVKAEKPELIVSGALTVKDFDYELKVILSRPGEKKDVLPFSFGDPSALLKTIITEITRSILTRIERPELKVTTFTDRWGAFEQFYEGEQAWEKLDITKASEKLRAALVYDNNFVLAKVRLAQVVLFNGSRLEAQELIHSVRPHLSLLSRLDSLRVEAIQARLEGDLFEEISILQDIYNTFPTRKEFAYDVAEAFYEICEIDKAIEYYNKALLLDENFARAHNHLAYCYSHRGQHEKALYHFRKYARLDSTANAFDSLGDGFMAAGKLDSAVWAKKQGIQLDPRLSYLWGSLGYINIRQGKLTEAEQNIQKYIDFSDRADRKARGIFRKALVEHCRQNYAAALDGCMSAQAVYDSTDLVTRDHDLHWLLGLLYLKFNEPEFARAEIDQMEQIINLYAINDTNYRMGIYKNYLALKIFEAAYRGNEAEMLTYMDRFDGPIQSKIKDHGSPFDLAYVNTTFGELLMTEQINRPDLAEARLKLALNYNPDYALAHYDLWQLYLKTGDAEKSMDHHNKFKLLWQQADEDVKGIYGF